MKTGSAETKVRKAVVGDADAISMLCAEHADYERAAFVAQDHPAKLARCMTGDVPRLVVFAADHFRDGLIGYAAVTREVSTWRAEDYLHMDCLFVRSGYRNQSIGLRLFDCVLQFARTEGMRHVEWQTPSWNEGASRFYQARGATGTDKLRFRIDLPI